MRSQGGEGKRVGERCQTWMRVEEMVVVDLSHDLLDEIWGREPGVGSRHRFNNREAEVEEILFDERAQ